MELEHLNVKFEAHISEGNNCICNACHNGGSVMKIKLPDTCYHDRKKLSTKYREYWLCCKCQTKLRWAMDWPDDSYQRSMEDTTETDILLDTINNALRLVSQAKELYLIHHQEDWDIDWAMDQFNSVETILEVLRGRGRPVSRSDEDPM